MFFVFDIYIMWFLCSNKLYFQTIIYNIIYNIFTKSFENIAPCFRCSRAFSEKLNQKFVNIRHTKWVKYNAILRRWCSARLSFYIYQYGEDVSVKQHQYHIVWNYQHLYFEIYDFFISVVCKIYVCTNKKRYISLLHRSFSHFHIIYFDWRSISLLHILKQ